MESVHRIDESVTRKARQAEPVQPEGTEIQNTYIAAKKRVIVATLCTERKKCSKTHANEI